jgi:hypothetical protein
LLFSVVALSGKTTSQKTTAPATIAVSYGSAFVFYFLGDYWKSVDSIRMQIFNVGEDSASAS